MNSQYIVPPPVMPNYFYKHYPLLAFRKLIEWAKTEHHARLRYCAERGYFKGVKHLNEDYSPMRVLAEVEGFRRMCAMISQEGWNKLSGRERVFLRRAYEMREMLLS
jgi:hypothetical protein